MKLIHLYGFILLSFLIFSCKKEIEEIPPSNSPIFDINGTIGGNTVDVKVDESTAKFESTYEKVNGVNFFKGTLYHSDFELEIGLFDGNLDKSSLSVYDLKNTSQLLFMQENNSDLFYANKFYFNNPQFISNIEWYVDGLYYSTNTISIKKPGRYEICAYVNYLDQTQNKLCNDVVLGYTKNAVFSLEYELGAEKNLVAWIYENNQTVSSVSWFVDGQFACDCLYLEKKLDNQIHEIKAEIVFQNGVRRTRKILVDGNNNEQSMIDFAFLENLSELKNDYKAKVVFKENGIIYRSDIVSNTTNKFEIKEVSYLGKNSNADNVYRVKGKVQLLVKAEATNETKFINLDVSWGFVLK